MRQGPLTGRYPAVAAMVVFALVPYLCLSAALQPISPIIARQLHMSMQAMTVALGMANAACAIGTVFAVRAGALRRAPDLPSSSHAYLVGDVTRSALRGREDKAARMLRLGR